MIACDVSVTCDMIAACGRTNFDWIVSLLGGTQLVEHIHEIKAATARMRYNVMVVVLIGVQASVGQNHNFIS